MKPRKRANLRSQKVDLVPPLITQNGECDWSDRIEHLQKGYETAQGVIELLDSKNNILIGLSTLVAGFTVSMVKWAIELEPNHHANWVSVSLNDETVASLAFVFIGTSLAAFVSVIVCCLFSVIARKAGHGKFTILFPIRRKEDRVSRVERRRGKRSAVSDYENKVRKFVRTLDRSAILEEYSEQLAAIGRILASKLNHNRWASLSAIIQITFFTVAIVLYFGAAFGLVR